MTTLCPEVCEYFRFSSQIFFLISRTGEMEVSVVPMLISEHYVSIFVFWFKKFSSISRFFVVAQVKGRCQWCKRGFLNSMRVFSFFDPINFYSISRFFEVA